MICLLEPPPEQMSGTGGLFVSPSASSWSLTEPGLHCARHRCKDAGLRSQLCMHHRPRMSCSNAALSSADRGTWWGQEHGVELHLPHYANAILCTSNGQMHTVTKGCARKSRHRWAWFRAPSSRA